MLSLKHGYSKTNIFRKTLLRLLSTSVEPAQQQTEYYEKELKEFEMLTNITKRTRTKKPKRSPFVKNLLVGEFDSEVLTFPQLKKEEVENVQKNVNILENILKQDDMANVNSLANKTFRQKLASGRVLGLQASQFMNGLESTPLEVVRYLEVISKHKLGDSLIYNEQLSIQTLTKFASESLHKKYLYPIMKGDKLAAFCVNESKLINMNTLQTKATLTKDKKYWILNGTKGYVVNGLSADYYIVFAATKLDILKNELKVTTFLVEKDSPGVTCAKIDSDNFEVAVVNFQNTQVPNENVIGDVNMGTEILNTILTDFRASFGPLAVTLMRNITDKLIDNVLKESTEKYMLYKTDAVRFTLGEIATNIYAAESISYLTAGLQDWYQDQDVTIESAIVKIFSTEAAYNIANTCLTMLNLPVPLTNHWASDFHEKARNYLTMYESNNNLKMFIALLGLQHVGVELSEKIKRLRNPLFNIDFVFTQAWAQRKQSKDDPSLDLELFAYVHPSLDLASQNLEYCVKRLEYAAEQLLTNHGLEIMNRHELLKRLADVMIDCYAMTAVLGRASRSYCIGLQYSHDEIILASAFCHAARERVQRNVSALVTPISVSYDKHLVDLGKQMTKTNKYFFTNSLTRNF